MTDRDYLSQLRNIDQRIRAKMEEEQRWRDIAVNTGAKITDIKVQTSKNQDPMGNAVTKAVEFQRESAELAVQLIDLKHTIIEQIDNLGDDKAYLILKMVFVQNKTYAEVAVALNRSYRHAVREIENSIKIFGNKYRHLYKDK